MTHLSPIPRLVRPRVKQVLVFPAAGDIWQRLPETLPLDGLPSDRELAHVYAVVFGRVYYSQRPGGGAERWLSLAVFVRDFVRVSP